MAAAYRLKTPSDHSITSPGHKLRRYAFLFAFIGVAILAMTVMAHDASADVHYWKGTTAAPAGTPANVRLPVLSRRVPVATVCWIPSLTAGIRLVAVIDPTVPYALSNAV